MIQKQLHVPQGVSADEVTALRLFVPVYEVEIKAVGLNVSSEVRGNNHFLKLLEGLLFIISVPVSAAAGSGSDRII